jgi:hypothetical protein
VRKEEEAKDMMNAHDRMKQFADDHNMTLKSLRVMAQANDPCLIGTPAHYKQAEWFLSYWQKFGYEAALLKVHLRRIHYRIVSLEPHDRRKPDTQSRGRKRKSDIYENTYNDWQYLITASKYARYLDLIDPELIIDQRSPEPGEYSKLY